jgi:hypothetical protein
MKIMPMTETETQQECCCNCKHPHDPIWDSDRFRNQWACFNCTFAPFVVGQQVYLKRSPQTAETITEVTRWGDKWGYRTTTNFGRSPIHWLSSTILQPDEPPEQDR